MVEARWCPRPPVEFFHTTLGPGVYGLNSAPVRVPPYVIVSNDINASFATPRTKLNGTYNIRSDFHIRVSLDPGGSQWFWNVGIRFEFAAGGGTWVWRSDTVTHSHDIELSWTLEFEGVDAFYVQVNMPPANYLNRQDNIFRCFEKGT